MGREVLHCHKQCRILAQTSFLTYLSLHLITLLVYEGQLSIAYFRKQTKLESTDKLNVKSTPCSLLSK